MDPTAPTLSLRDFLVWLFSAGGAAAAVSFITERIPEFQTLPSRTRNMIHIGASLLLALGAYAIITYVPQPTLDALLPWFQIAAGVIGTWMLNQMAHKADPARDKVKYVQLVGTGELVGPGAGEAMQRALASEPRAAGQGEDYG